LWTLSGDGAVRIDAATGHVVATVPLNVPVSNPVRTLAVSDDGTRLYVGWATPEQTDGVTEFDATSGHVLHQNAHAGGGPSSIGPQLNYAGARLWVTFPTGNLGASVALNASDLTATGEVIRGPNAFAIAPDTNVVWVSRVTQLDCVTPNDLTLASHALPGSVTSAVATTPAAVYVATGNGIATIKRDRACPR
jgi:DNA-binding beta-propeller fold protein YncE